MSGRRCQARERGSILLITLLIVMTLVGLVVGFSDESVLSLTLSGYSRDVYRAREAARAGAHAALDRIALDPDRELDGLQDEWAGFEGVSAEDLPEGVVVTGGIADEGGKLNMNLMVNAKGEIDEKRQAQFLRLFRTLGLDEGRAAPVLDWLDGDEIERMGGAESYYYQGLERPYASGNGPFLTMAQLRLVKGMSGWDAGKYLTLYSDGKININTAPVEVLQCLSEKIDSALAEAIASHRGTEVFRRPEDVKRVPGMSDEVFNGVSPWVCVSSSAFSIRVNASVGDVSSGVTAVAVRDKDGVRVIYWQGR